MDIEKRLQHAVQSYWDARSKNKEKQREGGKIDAGTRGEVTGGTQMGAMEVLVADILCDAGLKKIDVKTRTALELPGYYRSEKKWDLIVVAEGQLVTAMEFKSQVGPSFGNNFNNRSEEAIGSATDVWVAYREGRFGKTPVPFLGYFFLLEDCDRVKTPVRNKEPYFKVDPVFDKVFMNPPYGREVGRWVQKAFEESVKGTLVVCLLPARTDTRWWQDYVKRGHVHFLRGRLKFGGARNAAPFPSAIVTFGRYFTL